MGHHEQRIEGRTHERPWGSFTTYAENTQATVKLLKVLQGEATSLQRHRNRDELWFFISGKGVVVLGTKDILIGAGDVVLVPRGEAHRIEGLSDVNLVEVALGDFDEDDIERLSDRYGRSSP